MCPRVSRISEDKRTASEKSDVMEVSAARNRLPKLWPSSPEPFSKRWRKSFESRASSSLRATMQLRMSPGGSMLSSLRRRPLEPPSSLTVTTAERSRMTGESKAALGISVGDRTKRFKPFSRVERPVPPPRATTRKPLSRAIFSVGRDSAVLVSIGGVLVGLRGLVYAEFVVGTGVRAGIRIEQLGETRVFGQVLEIGIVACLEA